MRDLRASLLQQTHATAITQQPAATGIKGLVVWAKHTQRWSMPFFVCERHHEALFGETVRGAFWAVSDAFFGVCLCRIQQKRGDLTDLSILFLNEKKNSFKLLIPLIMY